MLIIILTVSCDQLTPTYGQLRRAVGHNEEKRMSMYSFINSSKTQYYLASFIILLTKVVSWHLGPLQRLKYFISFHSIQNSPESRREFLFILYKNIQKWIPEIFLKVLDSPATIVQKSHFSYRRWKYTKLNIYIQYMRGIYIAIIILSNQL